VPQEPRSTSHTSPMREALRVEATVGEVCEVLRGSWGTYDAHGAHG